MLPYGPYGQQPPVASATHPHLGTVLVKANCKLAVIRVSLQGFELLKTLLAQPV